MELLVSIGLCFLDKKVFGTAGFTLISFCHSSNVLDIRYAGFNCQKLGSIALVIVSEFVGVMFWSDRLGGWNCFFSKTSFLPDLSRFLHFLRFFI